MCNFCTCQELTDQCSYCANKLAQREKEKLRTDFARRKWSRNHAAALLRKVRAQRDAAEKERVRFEASREFWRKSSATHGAEIEQLRAQLAATEDRSAGWCRQSTEADAATQAALQVAEREHARAEAANKEADEVLNLLMDLMRSTNVASNYGETQRTREKVQRWLVAHDAHIACECGIPLNFHSTLPCSRVCHWVRKDGKDTRA